MASKKEETPVQETDIKQTPVEIVGVIGVYGLRDYIPQPLAAESDLERKLGETFLDKRVCKLTGPSEETSYDQSSQDTPSDQTSQDNSFDQPSQDISSDQSSQDSSSASSSQKEKKQSSRFESEFEEQKKIGKGHYGQVYKAKHKLDKQLYAIKEILIDDNLDKVAREAEILAKLNHPCITRYFSSWTEDTVSTEEDGNSKQSSSGDSIVTFSGTDSDQNCSAKDVGEFNVNVRDVSNNSSCKPPSEIPTAQKDMDGSIPELKQICGTLYIVMELCDKSLEKLMDEKNDIDDSERKAIFRQIVEAVIYLHSKGIVHQDLKLANIFIKEENGKYLVKVGDFGISASAEKKNKMSDIIQLCKIFFTLFPQYCTGMGYQEALKDKTIPKDIEQNGPELVKLVFMMRFGGRSSLTELLEAIGQHETEELRGGKATPESQ